jgi:hypothetical protein
LILINLLVWAGLSWYVPERQPVSRFDGRGLTLVSEVEAAADTGLRLTDRPAVPAETEASEDEAADGETAGAPESDEGAPEAAADADDSAASSEAPDAGAALAANETGAPPAGRCVAIGPFAQPDDAANAAAALAAAGMSARERRAEQEIWEGYWVYIEQIESTQAANAMLASLTANGIADAYVISRSDSGVLISLGVYSEITRAGTRAAQVGRLGHEATISERTRMAEVRWLELVPPDSDSIDLDALRPPGRISRLELTSCRE